MINILLRSKIFWLVLIIIVILMAWLSLRQTNSPNPNKINTSNQVVLSDETFTAFDDPINSFNQTNDYRILGYSSLTKTIYWLSTSGEKSIGTLDTEGVNYLAANDEGSKIIFGNLQTRQFGLFNTINNQQTKMPADTVSASWDSNDLIRLVSSNQKLSLQIASSPAQIIETGLSDQGDIYSIESVTDTILIKEISSSQDYTSSQIYLANRKSEQTQSVASNVSDIYDAHLSEDATYIIIDHSDNSTITYYNIQTGKTVDITAPNLFGKPVKKIGGGAFLHVSQITGLDTTSNVRWQINMINAEQSQPTHSFSIEVPTNKYSQLFYTDKDYLYGIGSDGLTAIPLQKIIELAS